MKFQRLQSRTFSNELIEEGSWGERPLGYHESTMTLFRDLDSPDHYYIEWEIPFLEEVITIGIWTDEGVLTDYDGTMSLPDPAIALLRHEGIEIPPEFQPSADEGD